MINIFLSSFYFSIIIYVKYIIEKFIIQRVKSYLVSNHLSNNINDSLELSRFDLFHYNFCLLILERIKYSWQLKKKLKIYISSKLLYFQCFDFLIACAVKSENWLIKINIDENDLSLAITIYYIYYTLINWCIRWKKFKKTIFFIEIYSFYF